MLVETKEFGRHDVRCLITETDRFLSICDFEKATECYVRNHIGTVSNQDTMLVNYGDPSIPSDLFKRPTSLRLVSLSCLRNCIESSFYADKTKQRILDWLDTIQSKEIASQPSVLEFNFGQEKVRTMMGEGGEPWFVAKDVCAVLDFKYPSDALKYLDEDEQALIINPSITKNPNGKVSLVNESGLYALIFKSRKPEAKRFKKWVTSEVLPQIRKTGQYHGIGNKPQLGLESVLKEFDDFKQQVFDKLENMEKSLVQPDNPFVKYMTPKERQNHKIAHDKANQLSNDLLRKLRSLTNEKTSKGQYWWEMWDEINYNVTGLNNQQLKSQRGAPDYEAGVRKLFTQQELELLNELLDFMLQTLGNWQRFEKSKLPQVAHELCNRFFNQKGAVNVRR
jgi:prophage antirepressor-like protein